MKPLLIASLLCLVLGTGVSVQVPFQGPSPVPTMPPPVLPAGAVSMVVQSLEQARPHKKSVWRDTPPENPDGTVNAYIEIPKGDLRKWEFRIALNKREVDRVMPPQVGGYPINYGIVPQTISYDGDPFVALVLGPPLEGGTLVRGMIVGVMRMDDEKGLDSKVILSRTGPDGKPLLSVRPADQRALTEFFNKYKRHEAGAGKHSTIPGFGTVAEGRAYVRTTAAFFRECRGSSGSGCRLQRPPQ